MVHDKIATTEQLSACIGKLPDAVRDIKVIDHLDAGAMRWLAASPLLFAGFGCQRNGAPDIDICLAGGAAGFIAAPDPLRLSIPLASLDASELPLPGASFGGLFLVPSLGETLRVNGSVEHVGPKVFTVLVRECYMHCAKALIRSDFWSPLDVGDATTDAAAWLASSRFLALASVNAEHHADVSPKGDPGGLLLMRRGDAILFAERLGNRRTDSFRNILAQPRISLAALIPARAEVAIARGKVDLLTDASLRKAFAVEDKLPKLVARIQDVEVALRPSPALVRANLWPALPAPSNLEPAALFAAHVQASRSKGLGARAIKVATAVPGLMKSGLNRDYRDNLY